MMIVFCTLFIAHTLLAHAQANIPIYPITNVDVSAKTGYFSDPFHVPFEGSLDKGIYIGGTTQKYLKCNDAILPNCASILNNTYDSSPELKQAVQDAGAHICSAAGIHPFQSGSGASRSWDALVTLHIQDNPDCKGISGWSVIVHAHASDPSIIDAPPTSWTGDKLLIGSFSQRVDANYDGKYFLTPSGDLYLIYQKQLSEENPHIVGVVAQPMRNPSTKTPDSQPVVLLRPSPNLNSENYVRGNDSFKLIETGNLRAINGKFLMAYSVGAFNHRTYKLGIAWSDTFLPQNGKQYRKVLKNNPRGVWNSQGDKEVWYLLQSEEEQDGWHYVGDKVLAPGVPTVAKIGEGGSWVLTFAGYDPGDAPVETGTNKFIGSHRRPYFVKLEVKVPESGTVEGASDMELQNWITPVHGN